VLTTSDVLTADTLPISADDDDQSSEDLEQGAAAGELMTLRELERRHIARVLESTGWHKRRACAVLQITRPTLDRKIRDYGLIKPTSVPPPAS
jgi:DNA-binding NtrC family response regulator